MVIELAFEDEHLRQLLSGDGIRAIGLLRADTSVWYNLPTQIHSKAEKALIALTEKNASIKDVVHSLTTRSRDSYPIIKENLELSLSYVHALNVRYRY